MAYFAPYIDGSGLHMPTYEDRLAALVENYRSIFGLDSELSESVPDYQLLSVFARSLDDASSLVLSAFHQMNPMYASGQALDLLLPQNGISRLPGETDAAVRSRIVTALAENGRTMEQNILAEVMKVPSIKQATMFVNDTNATDAKGIPAHSICVVAFSDSLQKRTDEFVWNCSCGMQGQRSFLANKYTECLYKERNGVCLIMIP